MTRIHPSIVVAAIVATAAALSFSLAMAQSTKRPADAKRGADIAAQGTANVPACAQCHAVSGASDSSTAFPRIAGQSAHYLETQMHDFASPLRTNDIMSPIVQGLSADDIADLVAYYASVSGEFMPLAGGDAAAIEKGRQLARVGDAGRGIQACNNCHGPDGAGLPPAIPYLAGQYADYIATELGMWKSGSRNNSPDAMAPIARQLDDQEIAAVAAFYQQARSSAAVVGK